MHQILGGGKAPSTHALCPFGALQELFGRIGRKILKKRLIMPVFLDKPLRYLKYLILLLTLGMAWHYGTLWKAPYDPYSAYTHLSAITDTIEEDPFAMIGFLLLAVSIAGSFLYDRSFCKYLCPAGAFYGIVGKLSPTN